MPLRASTSGFAGLLLLAGTLAGCGGGVGEQIEAAERAQRQGRFEESIPTLRRLVEREPAHPRANLLLGTALLHSGRPTLAVFPLERASRDEELAVEAGLLLARAQLVSDNFQEAVRTADRVLERDPEQPAGLHLRARALLSAQQPEPAIEDARRLLEIDPGDTTAALLLAAALVQLERLDEAEAVYRELKDFAVEGEPTAIAGWIELARLHQRRGDLEQAATEFEGLLIEFPAHPLVGQRASEFFDAQQRFDRSLELWRAALEQDPDDASVRAQLAWRHAAMGDPARAEELLEEGTRVRESAAAFGALAELRRARGDSAGAVTALERAVELAGSDADPLRFALADTWVDSGELDRAEQISAGLPEMYRYLIVGRVSLARGEPAAALQNLEAAIRLWPNHAVARYLAGQAALRLGDPERAVEELREAWRNGKGQTDAAVALAQLQLARGQLDEAAEFARLYLGRPESRGRPAAAEALAVLVRVAAARGEDAAVAELLGALAKRPGQAARAAAESAALARDAGDLRGAVAAIDASGLDLADPAHHLALASLVQDLASADETRKALARLDAVIEAQGENAALLDLRGRVLALAERGEEAQTAFEAALALDASYAPALAGLATLAADRGQREQALELFERAAKAAPERSGPAYHAASLSLELGRREEALGLLEEIVRRDPGHAEARNDLAWLLAESGADLDRAVALAEEASAMRPGSNTLDTLGFARLRKGDVEGAVEAFERSLARDPTAASVRYRLGVALARRGEPQAARAAWRAALETSADFPEAQAAREALARLPAASPSL